MTIKILGNDKRRGLETHVWLAREEGGGRASRHTMWMPWAAIGSMINSTENGHHYGIFESRSEGLDS